jgi:uncharacterized membrane protein
LDSENSNGFDEATTQWNKLISIFFALGVGIFNSS